MVSNCGVAPANPIQQSCKDTNQKFSETMANAPWYVTKQTLHTDLQIPYLHTLNHDRINKHRIALASHPNPLVEPKLHPEHNRRLKRR